MYLLNHIEIKKRSGDCVRRFQTLHSRSANVVREELPIFAPQDTTMALE
jgi:hypothetical protein